MVSWPSEPENDEPRQATPNKRYRRSEWLARVDAPRLALACNRREAPERGRDREEREQQEIRNELDLEAAHSGPVHLLLMLKVPAPAADTSFE